MLILDANHLRILQVANKERAEAFAALLVNSGQDVATSVVVLAENLRGWANEAVKPDEKTARQALSRLNGLMEFYADWNVLQYGDAEATELIRISAALKGHKRPGVADLRQIAIASVAGGTLLTEDRTALDAAAVVGVKAANWIPRIPGKP